MATDASGGDGAAAWGSRVTPQLGDERGKEVQDPGQHGLPPGVAVRPSDLRDAGHLAHAHCQHRCFIIIVVIPVTWPVPRRHTDRNSSLFERGDKN